MLTKHTNLSTITDLVGSGGVFSESDTVVSSATTTPTLSRVSKAEFLSQPAGYVRDLESDFWIQMEFGFDGKKSEVVVTRWWITDYTGSTVSLSKLTYSELQFISQAMAEEFQFHSKHYYHELESSYYEGRI